MSKCDRLYLIGLLTVIVFDLVLLLGYYVKFRTPLGWDTPAYIATLKFTDEKGVYNLFILTNFLSLYNYFSYFIYRSLIHDPFLTEDALPIFLNIAFILLSANVARRLFKDSRLAVFTAFFWSTSFGLIRLTADLRRNLTGFLFWLPAFLLASEAYTENSKRKKAMLSLFLLLAILAHLETALVLLLLLSIYVFIMAFESGQGSRVKRVFKNLSWLYMTPVMIFVLTYPYSMSFLENFYEVLLFNLSHPPPTLDLWGTLSPMIPWANIPLLVLGFGKCVGLVKGGNKGWPLLLLIWSIVLSLSLVFFPLHMWWRFLILFPTGFLASVGLSSFLHAHSSSALRKSAIVVMVILIISLNAYFANSYANVFLRPWISDETYENLRFIETLHLPNKPVIIMYRNDPWAGDRLKMYDAWLNATLGINEFYVYVGTLYGLLHSYQKHYDYRDLEAFSTRCWEEMERDGVLKNLDEHPIMVLTKDFYLVYMSPYEKALLNEIEQGLYAFDENYRNRPYDLHSLRLISFLDYTSFNGSWYTLERDWASTGIVLERYELNPRQAFHITYDFPLEHGVYYVKIKLWDVASSFAPLEVIVDKKIITDIQFNGTLGVKDIIVPLGYVDGGMHELTLALSDLAHDHLLTLDYIDILYSSG